MVRKKSSNYAKKHPDAAKVYLTGKGIGVMTEAVLIHAVDGASTHTFVDGMKSGIYLLAGTHTVDVEYKYTRAGVIHKTVTTTTGVVKKKLTVVANMSYMLRYDRKNNEFIFEEI